jgi:hypothetical protein
VSWELDFVYTQFTVFSFNFHTFFTTAKVT